MAKRILCTAVIILVVFCLDFSNSYAQESLDDLKAQLRNLRLEIAKTTDIYKQELTEIKKECQNNIGVIKKEFHKKRSAYIAERNAREEELEKKYKNAIQPMKVQEKRLVNKIEPMESNNFAKRD